MKYEVTEEIDVLHNSQGTDFTIELNRVSWNNKPPQIDIRRWNRAEDAKFVVGKGVSLPDEAVERLVDALLEKGYGSNKALKVAVKERGLVKSKKEKAEEK